MAAPGAVLINFYANTKDAVRDVGRLTRSLEGTGRVSKVARGAMKGLAVGAAGVAAGAVAAGVAFVDFAKEAYADKQNADKLTRTLSKLKGITDDNIDATHDWIAAYELLSNISDDDLRVALGKIVVATKDVADAQKLTALSADAAVGANQDFNTVAEAMSKAVGGQTTSLKRLFPFLDAGPDKVLTLKEAVTQLTDAYGGAAKAAADNDLFGRLETVWGNIKEALGQAALPTLEAVSDWFSDKKNINAIQEWVDKLGDYSRTIGEDYLGKIQDFIAYLQSPEGQAAMQDFAKGARDMADAIGAITGQIGEIRDAWNSLPEWLRKVMVFGATHGGVSGTMALAGMGDNGSSPSGSRRVGGGNFNVTINNGKQDKTADAAAMALRLARLEKWGA